MAHVKMAVLIAVLISWILCSLGVIAMENGHNKKPILKLIGAISWIISALLAEFAVSLVWRVI